MAIDTNKKVPLADVKKEEKPALKQLSKKEEMAQMKVIREHVDDEMSEFDEKYDFDNNSASNSWLWRVNWDLFANIFKILK